MTDRPISGSAAPDAYVRLVQEAPDWDKSNASDGLLVVTAVNLPAVGLVILGLRLSGRSDGGILLWTFCVLLMLFLWSLGWRWLRTWSVRSHFGPIEILRTGAIVSEQPFEVTVRQHVRRSLNIMRVELSLFWLAEYQGQTTSSMEQPRPALATKQLWCARHTAASDVSIAAGGLLEARHRFTIPDLAALQREADGAFAARKAKADTWLDETTRYSSHATKWCLEIKILLANISSGSYVWTIDLRKGLWQPMQVR